MFRRIRKNRTESSRDFRKTPCNQGTYRVQYSLAEELVTKITNLSAGLFFQPHQFCRADSFRSTLTRERAVIAKEHIMKKRTLSLLLLVSLLGAVLTGCGDGSSDIADGMGLVAPRVMACAAHQANAILRIIAGEYEA